MFWIGVHIDAVLALAFASWHFVWILNGSGESPLLFLKWSQRTCYAALRVPSLTGALLCVMHRYIFGPLQGLGNAIVYGLNKTVKDEYSRVCRTKSSRNRKATAVRQDDLKVGGWSGGCDTCSCSFCRVKLLSSNNMLCVFVLLLYSHFLP